MALLDSPFGSWRSTGWAETGQRVSVKGKTGSVTLTNVGHHFGKDWTAEIQQRELGLYRLNKFALDRLEVTATTAGLSAPRVGNVRGLATLAVKEDAKITMQLDKDAAQLSWGLVYAPVAGGFVATAEADPRSRTADLSVVAASSEVRARSRQLGGRGWAAGGAGPVWRLPGAPPPALSVALPPHYARARARARRRGPHPRRPHPRRRPRRALARRSGCCWAVTATCRAPRACTRRPRRT